MIELFGIAYPIWVLRYVYIIYNMILCIIYWYSFTCVYIYIYFFFLMAILVKQDLRFDSKGESIRTPSCDHPIETMGPQHSMKALPGYR